VPAVWPSPDLASRFDACAFSCEAGVMKPDAEVHLHALRALGLRPGDTLSVGDGSDQELTGARGCGLRPVLVRADLSDTHDAHRSDVEAWDGPAVDTLAELAGVIAAL
jgi:putative hydrolase of the HAD superfamily